MQKYHNRPKVIEAEQWFPGKEIAGLERGPFGIGVVTVHGQLAYLSPGDYVIAEPDGIHHYPCKPDIFEAGYYPVVQHCEWCPVPNMPSPAHHPDGKAEHVLLRSWAEVADGLRRAGWTVEFKPLMDMPDYLWRSPKGISGSDYRSNHPQSPPDAVMRDAFKSGIVGFLELGPDPL